MHNRAEIRNTLLICVVLAVATVMAFWPITNAQFVSLDDPTYISDNLRVQRGLTAENVKWAFTTFYFSNWHPVTWLSYMLDCELFGVDPGAMHRVNLGLHTASAVLLFLVLKRLTAALWASAIVAALFALHPLHVESVAWIAERKDVLSTLFWILTIWTYVEYVGRHCAGFYIAALLCFSLGLMSKAMLVTLPFVLLLIDVWPLRRIDLDVAGWRRHVPWLLWEKAPFLAFAGLSGYLTFAAQRQGESITSFVRLPFSERFENAAVSYVRYLGKTFWPSDLAVFYPHPGEWSLVQVTAAGALILIITALATLTLRRLPWFFCGWFWFLVTLVPVIGIVQVGGQSMADRYAYIPLIGLFLAVVWGVRHVTAASRLKTALALAVSAVVIVACFVITYRQSGHWKNSLALFTHAAKVTPANAITLNNLGNALLNNGRSREAAETFKAALELNPEDPWAWGNVGNVYLRAGKTDEAIQNYREGLRHTANNPELHCNLALALAAKGEFSQAILHHERALALRPFYLNARLNLGNACLGAGHLNAAATNYLAVLELKPDFAPAHYNLGNVRLGQRRIEEAVKHFSEAVRLDGTFAEAHRQLAAALEQAGRPTDALPPLRRALALNPSSPGIRAELAALFAGLGQTQEAILQYREALKLDANIPAVLNNLAWILATHPDAALRDGPEAVRLSKRAVELTGRTQPFLLGTLAAAYAESGRFDEAMKTAEEGIRIAEQNGQKEVASKNKELLERYRQRQPWREPLAHR